MYVYFLALQVTKTERIVNLNVIASFIVNFLLQGFSYF